MTRIWSNFRAVLIALAVLFVILLMSIVIVPETHQAVVIRTGEPVRVANNFDPDERYGQTGSGMIARIPILERVQLVDKRILLSLIHI